MLNSEVFREIEAKAKADGRVLVPDCLIANDEGKIFVQKRSPDRRMFPGMWEIPGGHVDGDETIEETIQREIKEELNLDVTDILAYLGTDDYDLPPQAQKQGDNPLKRSVQFLVTAVGQPVLEVGKVTECRWIGVDELDILLANRLTGDDYTYRVVKKALALI